MSPEAGNSHVQNLPRWRSRCDTAQGQPQDFGDDDGFEFLEGGVLAIHSGNEEK